MKKLVFICIVIAAFLCGCATVQKENEDVAMVEPTATPEATQPPAFIGGPPQSYQYGVLDADGNHITDIETCNRVILMNDWLFYSKVSEKWTAENQVMAYYGYDLRSGEHKLLTEIEHYGLEMVNSVAEIDGHLYKYIMVGNVFAGEDTELRLYDFDMENGTASVLLPAHDQNPYNGIAAWENKLYTIDNPANGPKDSILEIDPETGKAKTLIAYDLKAEPPISGEMARTVAADANGISVVVSTAENGSYTQLRIDRFDQNMQRIKSVDISDVLLYPDIEDKDEMLGQAISSFYTFNDCFYTALNMSFPFLGKLEGDSYTPILDWEDDPMNPVVIAQEIQAPSKTRVFRKGGNTLTRFDTETGKFESATFIPESGQTIALVERNANSELLIYTQDEAFNGRIYLVREDELEWK